LKKRREQLLEVKKRRERLLEVRPAFPLQAIDGGQGGKEQHIRS
jgi:hypothetical protein